VIWRARLRFARRVVALSEREGTIGTVSAQATHWTFGNLAKASISELTCM